MVPKNPSHSSECVDSLAVVCQTVGDRLGKNEKTKVVAKLQNPVGPNIQTEKKTWIRGGREWSSGESSLSGQTDSPSSHR
jgi:hypothetical protein